VQKSIDLHIEKNISFDDLSYEILGDELRIKQILVNYISNALKFTPDGGKIQIKVTVSDEALDMVLLKIEVQDTGIGIPAEAFSRLFHTFEQGDNSHTRKYGGTGLGLSITKKLAHLM